MSAIHHHVGPPDRLVTCERFLAMYSAVSGHWDEVTCKWCLRHRPGPKVTVEGLSYRMTVKASGRAPRHFAGHTSEELQRDLEAARAEIAGSGS